MILAAQPAPTGLTGRLSDPWLPGSPLPPPAASGPASGFCTERTNALICYGGPVGGPKQIAKMPAESLAMALWLQGGIDLCPGKKQQKKNKKTKDNSPLRCPDLPGSYGPDVQGRGLAYGCLMSSSLIAWNQLMAWKSVAKFASKHLSTFAVPWHRHTERPAQWSAQLPTLLHSE